MKTKHLFCFIQKKKFDHKSYFREKFTATLEKDKTMEEKSTKDNTQKKQDGFISSYY